MSHPIGVYYVSIEYSIETKGGGRSGTFESAYYSKEQRVSHDGVKKWYTESALPQIEADIEHGYRNWERSGAPYFDAANIVFIQPPCFMIKANLPRTKEGANKGLSWGKEV